MLLETPKVQSGWQAADFTLADPDGNQYSLADVKGENGLVVAFICNHCPYVQAVADRFAKDANALQAEGVGVVAINSNDYQSVPDDSPPMMKRFAAQHGFPFPYLVDEDQSVGKAYGAVCTPDFFGFDAEGKLRYRGRLDDARMGDPTGRRTELLDALRQIASGEMGPDERYPSMGCLIKWS